MIELLASTADPQPGVLAPGTRQIREHFRHFPRRRSNILGARARVAADLWRLLKPLIIFESLFKLAAVAIAALGTACVISPLIARSGRAAVTNTDIAQFLISWPGLLTIVVLAVSFLVGTMFEHVGVIAIAASHFRGRDVTAAETLDALKAAVVRVVSFSIAELAMLAALCAVCRTGRSRLPRFVVASRHQLLPGQQAPKLVRRACAWAACL